MDSDDGPDYASAASHGSHTGLRAGATDRGQAMNRIEIRPADARDAEAVCAFHVRIWHQTYPAYAAPETVSTLTYAYRLPEWQRRLSAPDSGQATWLALDKARILGMVHFGPPRLPEFGARGEVKLLYVDPRSQGAGIGRRLVALARRELAASGYPEMGLAVVVQNTRALGFYRAIGGTEVTRYTDPGPMWKSENVLMAWPPWDPSDAAPGDR